MARDDILVFRRMINGRNTLRLYAVSESSEITPISIIPDDDYEDMFNSEYEFCADNFMLISTPISTMAPLKTMQKIISTITMPTAAILIPRINI